MQEAPQTSQTKVTFESPELPSRRLPQSVQKTSEPIADMMDQGACEKKSKSRVRSIWEESKLFEGAAKKSRAALEMAGGDLEDFPRRQGFHAHDLVVACFAAAGERSTGNGRVSALRALVARSRWMVHQGHLHLTPQPTTPECRLRRPFAPSRTPRCFSVPLSPSKWPYLASRSQQHPPTTFAPRRPHLRRTSDAFVSQRPAPPRMNYVSTGRNLSSSAAH